MTSVIGVDSSTQSCKVEVRDADDGTLLGAGSAPHPATTPPVSEQDPRAWWEAFLVAADAALAGVDRAGVRAVSVDAQCHGLVLLDDAGDPLRTAKLWNDTTSSDQAAALVERIGAERFARCCGTVPTSAFTISKVAWTQEHQPEVLRRARHLLVPHEYLTFRLGGRAVTDRSDASGTGYFDPVGNVWLPDFLDAVAPDDWLPKLPQVLAPAEAAGTLRADVAARLGLRPDVLIGPGAGDQHAGALGLGAQPGDVVVSIGTSGVVFAPSTEPVADETGWVSGTADAAGGFLPLICTLNAAKVTDTAARWLGVTVAELSDLAMAAPAGDSGLTFVTYLDGERTPNRPHATGLLHGLRTDTDRGHIARAAVEGAVLGLLMGYGRMAELGVRRSGRLILTGGGARSSAYRQVVADLFAAEVHVADVRESSARGACVQAAAVAAGRDVADTVARWRPPTEVVARPSGVDRTALVDRYRTLSGREDLDGDATRAA
ncbi:xylulokinase [Nakamurella endophytica]|uniref:Xylulose kinase n=1 Tax=Nakamurella endophytica TaxID=1748367 RepID=A0A917T9H3_9ACTN|nr:xylulokinase [Nakamurella endophytica]GGM14914.1 xylulose kinase [Nakamurella endophytica]